MNPRRPVFPTDLRTWLSAGLNQTTLLPSAGPAPFVQSDYPNPIRAKRVQDWVKGINPNLLGGGIAPFNQTDYPLRYARPHPIAARTWIQPANTTTLAPAFQAPFAQYEWPVPKGYASRLLRGWVHSLNPNLFGGGIMPFKQTDYPLPRAYAPKPRAIGLRFWNVNILETPETPVSVTDVFPTGNSFTLSLGSAAVSAWSNVPDTETPGWVEIPTAAASWNPVDTSETPGWVPIEP